MNGIHHVYGPSCPGCLVITATAHPYMRDWFNRKKYSYMEMHTSWAWRGMADQNLFFYQKRSQLTWPSSSHNRMVAIDPTKPFDPSDENCPNCRKESLALDIFQINSLNPNGLWSPKFMSQLNLENEKDGEIVRWGGKWKHLGDLDHFEYAGPL